MTVNVKYCLDGGLRQQQSGSKAWRLSIWQGITKWRWGFQAGAVKAALVSHKAATSFVQLEVNSCPWQGPLYIVGRIRATLYE